LDSQIELPVTLQRRTILALNKFGQVVTSSLKLEDVLARILDEVTTLLDAEGVAILMPEGDDLKFVAVCGGGAAQLKGRTMPRDSGVVGHVMQTGEAVWLNPQESNAAGLTIYRQIESVSAFHTESLLAAPLVQGDRPIGVLEAAHSRPDGLTAEDLPVLVAAANWAAIAISNAQLHEQAQKLREQQALMEERARLARELHDAVTQSLYSMSVLAGAWRRQIEAGQLQPQPAHIAELGELAQHALREVRLLIYELRPTELEEEGLLGALYRRLETVEQRAGIRTRLTVTDEAGRPYPLPPDGRAAMVDFDRLPPALEHGLYRIAQEALNNALKHGGATAVAVHVRLGGAALTLEIEDNGRGFDADAWRPRGGGFGLTGMEERARQLGGRLIITSSPTGGTIIRVAGIPYKLPPAEEKYK
jgi:signal transduction histidine kinase